MTLVLACRVEGKTVMMGDSFSGHTQLMQRTARPKVWKCGDVLIGAAGCPRGAAIVRSVNQWPDYDENTEVLSKFLMGLYDEADYTVTREGKKDQPDLQLIVAYPNAILEISGFTVTESDANYDAIGAGAYIAIGAMHASSRYAPSAHHVVNAGMSAALAHSPWVCWPVSSVSTINNVTIRKVAKVDDPVP